LAACRIRASFERVAHLVGALAVADHQDIEDALIDAVEVPEEASSISVSLDRVSVPMEEPRRRPARRSKKGAPKKPVERNFRMAYCGTVTLHDKDGVGRHTIRYGCMPDGDVIGLRDRVAADVATLRSKRPDLKIELLWDGVRRCGICWRRASFLLSVTTSTASWICTTSWRNWGALPA
jgi:hypothetical protein